MRVDVSNWVKEGDEPSGKSVKFWLINPDTHESWLLKKVRFNRIARTTADYSEVIAWLVAKSLGVPAAEYKLATYDGAPSVISKNIAYKPGRLLEGWKWLRKNHADIMPFAIHSTSESGDRQPKDYNIEKLHQCLSGLDSVADWAKTGFDLFAGYLLLDTLIGNTDRHAANWSVIEKPHGADILAPTYDHGASLAHQLTEEQRKALLVDENKLELFCNKAVSKTFARINGSNQKILDIYNEAIKLTDSAAQQHLRNMLFSEITEDKLRNNILNTGITNNLTTELAIKIILTNKRRVLDNAR